MMPHRSRLRAYFLLSRISNLPTVWSNVLTGTVVSGAVLEFGGLVRVAFGVSLLYTAGMFLNDAFDREWDAEHRPDRPLPSGAVSREAVIAAAVVLMVAGLASIAVRADVAAVAWGLALVAVILYYNWLHKRDPLGPVWMGVCRGLVYCIAASAAGAAVSWRVGIAAGVMTLYVVVLTLVAKRLGPRANVIVPALLAGIAVVDAGLILSMTAMLAPALVAMTAAVLTHGFQRVVPGT